MSEIEHINDTEKHTNEENIPKNFPLVGILTVLSYNLCIEAERNLFWDNGANEHEHAALLRDARAVILPQGCPEELYQFAIKHCKYVFPDYQARFRYPGKTGQALLFKKMGVPHPVTRTYNNLREWLEMEGRTNCMFPSVFKLAWGGEGKNVALLQTENDLDHCLQKAAESEKAGKNGFLIQEYIPTDGKSLRVVVIGEHYYSYWRIAPKDKGCQKNFAENFYSNLAKGAIIDRNAMPDRQEAAVQALRSFCQKTHINLAGVDFIFSEDDVTPAPLFLEINYCFRCKGLGGHDNYVKFLVDWVRNWLETTTDRKSPTIETTQSGRLSQQS